MLKAAPLESRRANNKVGAVGQEEVVVSRQYVRATVRSKAFGQVKSARTGSIYFRYIPSTCLTSRVQK